MRVLLPVVAAALLLSRQASAEQIIPISGEVPGDASLFFVVPFEVPEGTLEIEVRHDDLSEANILDWGINDQAGAFRGWGGGNTEPAIVGIDSASRSYLTGP